jgi:predicted small secreted protein
MKRTISIIAFAILTCAALAAGAQGQGKGGEINDVTEYIFNDLNVTGGVIGPEGVRIDVRKQGKTRSLIKVRTNFVRSMLKSVEDI